MDAAQTLLSGLYNLAKGEETENSQTENQIYFDWKSIFRSPPNTSTDSEFASDESLLFSGMDLYGEGASFSSQSQRPISPIPRTVSLPAFNKEALNIKRLNSRPSLEPSTVVLSGRTCDSKVLTQGFANQISIYLPAILRLSKNWKLLYSIDQHGLSLSTLFRNVRNKGPCVVAIRDSEDQVFGAFLSEPPEPSPSYYGTGECFLWKELDSKNTSRTSQVEVFKWTGRNHYTVLCEPDYISIGGGDGKYGLWIDSELDKGLSQTCATFNNKPLAGSQESFRCLEIEIWGFSM